MGRIVAIAGGDLVTTQKINQYMTELSGKVRPNALFIGTASQDDEGYIENFKTAFVDVNGEISFIRSREDARAYWLDYDNDDLHKEEAIIKTL